MCNVWLPVLMGICSLQSQGSRPPCGHCWGAHLGGFCTRRVLQEAGWLLCKQNVGLEGPLVWCGRALLVFSCSCERRDAAGVGLPPREHAWPASVGGELLRPRGSWWREWGWSVRWGVAALPLSCLLSCPTGFLRSD